MNPRTQLAVAAAGVTLLSASSLHAVFTDSGWIAPVVGAVLAVLVGAEVGSRLGQHLVARSAWRFVGAAAGLLFYLTAVFAHDRAILGFIPRGYTWHLMRLQFDKAFHEVHSLATPAPTYRALMFLTAFGVGCVAIAVDQLSIRPPLIGLALLALYSVPEWLSPHGTGWVPLALGGAAYVGLLIREGRDRTSRWGRTVTGATTMGRNRTAAAAMSQAGWRIGTGALAVALVVPPLIPDFGHFTLAKGGGRAINSPVHYNLFASVSGSLHQGPVRPQYSYTASDGNGQYLRMATLDYYDSRSGQMERSPQIADPVDPTTQNLTPEGVGPAAAATSLITSITIGSQLDSPVLPLPTMTTKITGLQGPWSYQEATETVFASDSSDLATRNQVYSTTSDVVSPTTQALEKSTLSPLDKTALAAEATPPSDMPAKIHQIALVATKGAKTEYEQAVALQNYFLKPGRFTYSLNGPPGKGYAALVAFLTTDRQGFCQQFATDMTLMARSLGLPARVGIGFTPGLQSDGSVAFHVDSQDYHAWPEIYFNGMGWLRFEPTPRTDGQTKLPSYGDTTVAAIQAAGKGSGSTTVTGKGGPIPQNKAVIPPEFANRGGSGGGTGGHGFPISVSGQAATLLMIALALLAILIGIPLVHAYNRRRRLHHGGDAREIALLAWRETLRDAFDLRYPTSPADSPRQTARRLTQAADLGQGPADALDRLARAVERARYAPVAADPDGLLQDAALVNSALYHSASRRVRLRARALPPSTMAWAGETASRASQAMARRWEQVTTAGGRMLRRRPSSV